MDSDPMNQTDQGPTIAFLSDPASHGPSVRRVERIDTHAALVFLAGERALKIKRAVTFPYLDFSHLDQRAEACRQELALNRRTAPKIYRAVVPITRAADGGFAFDGDGEVVEWAVVMTRFDQETLFDQLAKAGSLDTRTMAALTDEILRFHQAEQPVPGESGEAARLSAITQDNIAELAARSELFAADRVADYDQAWRALMRDLVGALDTRRRDGFVRHCHGDLHLGNICLFRGQPTLFDCLEFSADLATIDVLYDLAFLLMDLVHRDLRAFANLVLNRYIQAAGDYGGLALLPLYLSARAAIRAKVSASAEAAQGDRTKARRLRAAAQRYFEEALAYLHPPAPRLIAVGGLSGSGKTSLARRLAPDLGPAPGAIHLRSDTLRKRLFGVDELARLPAEAYAPDLHQKVYDGLSSAARAVLAAGHGVVLDAVYSQPAGRTALEALAAEAGVGFTGLWLSAPAETLVARVEARRDDASDATAQVVLGQLSEPIGPMTWHQIPAGGDLDQVVAQARAVIDLS